MEIPAMNKLYTVIALDALENPTDRIEVHCENASQAYETAMSVWEANLPELMWIAPNDADWYVAVRKTPAYVQ